jgi:hypothetical protein
MGNWGWGIGDGAWENRFNTNFYCPLPIDHSLPIAHCPLPNSQITFKPNKVENSIFYHNAQCPLPNSQITFVDFD